MLKASGAALSLIAFFVPLMASAASCPALSRGSTGSAVTAVQQILFNAYQGFPSPTGYFGPVTAAAVTQWQGEHGIDAIGTVGPKTAAAMKIGLCADSNSNTISSSVSASNSNQSLINALLAQIKILQAKIAALLGTAQANVVSIVTASGGGGGSSVQVHQSTISCSLDGITVLEGATAQFFSSRTLSTGRCADHTLTRTCKSGSFDGDGAYAFAACTESTLPPATCSFQGSTVQDGSSITAYQAASVAYGSSCVSEARTCQNGTLSGSYTNASCTVGQALACSWNNQSIANGATVTAYQTGSVAYGQQCVSESRTCSNGVLSGGYQFASCAPSAAASCTFNGQSVAHGASVTAYQSAQVPFGSQCISQVRSCSNGTLSGTYTNAACVAGAAASCTFNGVNVPHGASVTAYQSSSVPNGQQCVSQTRTCTNGSLSGSYTYGSCTAGQLQQGDTVAPEAYGAKHDGVTNDAPAIQKAIDALSAVGGGTVQLACNATYSLSNPMSIPYFTRTMKVEIVPKSNVNITGCGPSSFLRLANNVNLPPVVYPQQLFGSLVTPIYATDPLSNATFSNFSLEMNGANNDCGGTCFTWSADIGSNIANNVTVDGLTILNNPYSNAIQFGDPSNPNGSSNITIKNNHLSYGGYAVNPAAFDYSAIWLSASNSTIINNSLDHGSPPGGPGPNPFGSGAAIEIHGNNILATGNQISDYWSGANIGNLSGSSNGLKFNGNTMTNVSEGVLVWSQAMGSTQDNVEVKDNSITLNADFPKDGVDLWEETYPFNPNAGTGQTITISGNTINATYPNSGHPDWCGINIGSFTSVTVTGNTVVNSPGAGICGRAILPGAALYINGNTINNSGINPSGMQSAIWFPASNNLPNWMAIKNNSIDTAVNGIWGALNVAAGEISGNTIIHSTTPIQWTGTGMTVSGGGSNTDAQRKADLQTLANALNKYYQKHGTYGITGAGAGGSGVGVVSQDGPPSFKTIVQGLYDDGDLASSAALPANPSGPGDYYLLYVCGNQYAFSAKLDNPSTSDTAYIQTTCNGTGANGTYSLYKRNYALQGTTPSIQLFGTYYSDTPAGGTTAPSQNYTSAIAPFANVTWIGARGPDAESNIAYDVAQAKSLHMGVILDVESYFFCVTGSHASGDITCGDSSLLNPSYDSDFTTLWNTTLANSHGSIKGFYVMDEPYDRCEQGALYGGTCDPAVLKQRLETVAQYLHQKAPGIPTMVIMNAPGNRSPMTVTLDTLASWIPPDVDWLGFDCYYSVRGTTCASTLPAAYGKYLAIKSPSQKAFLVPDTWSEGINPGDTTLASELQTISKSLALSSKEIVGSFAFIYQNGAADAGEIGLQSLSQTLQGVKDWLGEIRTAGGAPAY